MWAYTETGTVPRPRVRISVFVTFWLKALCRGLFFKLTKVLGGLASSSSTFGFTWFLDKTLEVEQWLSTTVYRCIRLYTTNGH